MNTELMLVRAIVENRRKVVEYLLTESKDANKFPKVRIENGDTILHAAVRVGNIEIIEEVLNYISNLEFDELQRFIDAKNDDGNTALHLAVMCEKVDVVKFLLINRADAEVKNNDGNTAIEIARNIKSEELKEKICKCLIKTSFFELPSKEYRHVKSLEIEFNKYSSRHEVKSELLGSRYINDGIRKVAVIGRKWAGKSALINALAGRYIAESGYRNNTTPYPRGYIIGNMYVVDFPGFDTYEYPYDDFEETFDFGCYDLVIFANSSAWGLESEAKCIKKLNISNCIFVSTHLDSLMHASQDILEINEDKTQIIENIKGYKTDLIDINEKENMFFVNVPEDSQKHIGVDILREGIEKFFNEHLVNVRKQRLKELFEKRSLDYSSVLNDSLLQRASLLDLTQSEDSKNEYIKKLKIFVLNNLLNHLQNKKDLDSFDTLISSIRNPIKIAVAGKYRSGKSTIINKILNGAAAKAYWGIGSKLERPICVNENNDYYHFHEMPPYSTYKGVDAKNVATMCSNDFEVVLLVVNMYISEEDKYIFANLIKQGKQCWIICNDSKQIILNGNDYKRGKYESVSQRFYDYLNLQKIDYEKNNIKVFFTYGIQLLPREVYDIGEDKRCLKLADREYKVKDDIEAIRGELEVLLDNTRNIITNDFTGFLRKIDISTVVNALLLRMDGENNIDNPMLKLIGSYMDVFIKTHLNTTLTVEFSKKLLDEFLHAIDCGIIDYMAILKAHGLRDPENPEYAAVFAELWSIKEKTFQVLTSKDLPYDNDENKVKPKLLENSAYVGKAFLLFDDKANSEYGDMALALIYENSLNIAGVIYSYNGRTLQKTMITKDIAKNLQDISCNYKDLHEFDAYGVLQDTVYRYPYKIPIMLDEKTLDFASKGCKLEKKADEIISLTFEKFKEQYDQKCDTSIRVAVDLMAEVGIKIPIIESWGGKYTTIEELKKAQMHVFPTQRFNKIVDCMGRSELMKAIIDGEDEKKIQELIDKSNNVNVLDTFGFSALVYAKIRENKDIAKLLKSKGATINVRDHNGRTPLMNAIRNDIYEEAMSVRNKSGFLSLMLAEEVDMSIVDSEGVSLVACAVKWGNKDILNIVMLGTQGAFRQFELTTWGAICFYSILATVIFQDNMLNTVPMNFLRYVFENQNDNFLLERRCEISKVIEKINKQDKDSINVLSYVVKSHDSAAIKFLREKGCQLNEIIEEINKQASSGNRGDVRNAIKFAIELNNYQLFKDFMNKEFDIDAVSKDGCSPLHFAVQNGDLEMVEKILIRIKEVEEKERRDDSRVNAFDRNGYTPIAYSVMNGSTGTIDGKVLVEAEFEATLKQNLNICRSFDAITKVLEEYGGSVNAQDKKGSVYEYHKNNMLSPERIIFELKKYLEMTILMHAARNGNTVLVYKLLNNLNIKINAMDFRRYNAIMHATGSYAVKNAYKEQYKHDCKVFKNLSINQKIEILKGNFRYNRIISMLIKTAIYVEKAMYLVDPNGASGMGHAALAMFFNKSNKSSKQGITYSFENTDNLTTKQRLSSKDVGSVMYEYEISEEVKSNLLNENADFDNVENPEKNNQDSGYRYRNRALFKLSSNDDAMEIAIKGCALERKAKRILRYIKDNNFKAQKYNYFSSNCNNISLNILKKAGFDLFQNCTPNIRMSLLKNQVPVYEAKSKKNNEKLI